MHEEYSGTLRTSKTLQWPVSHRAAMLGFLPCRQARQGERHRTLLLVVVLHVLRVEADEVRQLRHAARSTARGVDRHALTRSVTRGEIDSRVDRAASPTGGILRCPRCPRHPRCLRHRYFRPNTPTPWLPLIPPVPIPVPVDPGRSARTESLPPGPPALPAEPPWSLVVKAPPHPTQITSSAAAGASRSFMECLPQRRVATRRPNAQSDISHLVGQASLSVSGIRRPSVG